MKLIKLHWLKLKRKQKNKDKEKLPKNSKGKEKLLINSKNKEKLLINLKDKKKLQGFRPKKEEKAYWLREVKKMLPEKQRKSSPKLLP